MVFIARSVRFSLVGWAAVYYGRRILRIADSPEFMWFMGGFIAICVIGSIVSIVQWVRISAVHVNTACSLRAVFYFLLGCLAITRSLILS